MNMTSENAAVSMIEKCLNSVLPLRISLGKCSCSRNKNMPGESASHGKDSQCLYCHGFVHGQFVFTSELLYIIAGV